MLELAVALLMGGWERLNEMRPMAGGEEAKYFSERIDHFALGPNFVKTYEQRYFVNENFVNDAEKVNTAIIDIGGEGAISGAPGGNKDSMDILGQVAKEYNAPIYSLEHRFYGESEPFKDDPSPLSNENLKYLSSRYAIADLVNFLREMDKQYCKQNNEVYVPGKPCVKWLAVGGSYPGALAGWVMQEHPGMLAASISSSGVVDARYNLPEFDTHTLATAGLPCGTALVQVFRDIEYTTEVLNDDRYLEKLSGNRKNLEDFYYYLADSAVMIFQYGNKAKFCQNINAVYANSSDITDYFINYLIDNNYRYAKYDRDFLKIDTQVNESFRQWWYQTCTEVAYYQPAPKYNSIRSKKVDLEYHLDVCKHAFDLELGDPTERTNCYYGKKGLHGENTFFSNFWQDIWHICSVTAEGDSVPKENIGYISTSDCGHCSDLHTIKSTDPDDMKALRSKEFDFVKNKFGQWDARK